MFTNLMKNKFGNKEACNYFCIAKMNTHQICL